MYKLLVLLPTTTGQTLSMLHFNSEKGLGNAIEWLRGNTVSGLECEMLVVEDHDARVLTDNTDFDDWKNINKRINNLRKAKSAIHEGLVEGLNTAFGANRVNMYIDRREFVRLMEIIIGSMPPGAPAVAIYSALQDYYKKHSFTVKP